MDVYLKQTSDSDMGVSTPWHKICTYIGQSMHGIGLKDEEEQFTISEWPRLAAWEFASRDGCCPHRGHPLIGA